MKLVPDLVAKCIIAPQKKNGKVYPTNLTLCMPLTHIGLGCCLSLTSALIGGEWKISRHLYSRENNPGK